MLLLRKFIYPLLLLLVSSSLLPANNFFAIRGNIAGLNKVWAHLDYLDDNNVHHNDSAFVLRGSFKFMGAIETPTFAILYFPSTHIQQNFFFDPGFTFIEGDTSVNKHLTIRGGNSTSLFAEYAHLVDSFNTIRRVHEHDKDDFYKSMSDEETATEQFIRAHPDSYVSANILLYKFSGESNINKGAALLSALDPKVQKSKYSQQFLQKAEALKKLTTGIPAPNFSEPDSSGKLFKLSDVKANYILLDFWASWCAPCRRESPGLVSAYKEFHAKGFEIISVSFDQNKNAWVNAISKDDLQWLNVCSFKGWDDEAAQLYHVSELPTNFLIDKNGVVVAKNLFGTGLDYELNLLMGQK